MECTTIRNGFDCPFMTAKGCSYNGGICHEIVEKCNGCNRGIDLKTTEVKNWNPEGTCSESDNPLKQATGEEDTSEDNILPDFKIP